MRIHVQNPADDPLGPISPVMWDQAALRAGEAGLDHTVSFGHTVASFAEAIGETEALIADKDVLPQFFPCPAPRLQLIFVANAGLDNLAPFDWLPPGVLLLNNRGTHAAKAGEFGIMALLMLANRVPEMATNQRNERWCKVWGGVLAGRRVSIIGLGALGGAIAAQAARFGMHVTGIRSRSIPHPDCAEVVVTDRLDSMLPGSEFFVLACPLTRTTRGIMDRRRLGLLPKRAGLVNIGRGALLDQDALCDLLDTGDLSGAVLDVFEPEPVPQRHRLWRTPNLIMSPHTAADDPGTYYPLSLDIFFDNVRALREGRTPPTLFDPARGY